MADASYVEPDAPASAPSQQPTQPPVVVKKYANRRLYNTETSSYITLDNLADMIRAGRDFVVYDAKSGEDITRGVLTQIIVEEESKGTSMLPTPFLRQLIGFYGGSLQGVVPRYLETAMSSFARQQQQLRMAMQQTLSPFLPMGVEEMSRQNMAMIERAMSLFNPFHRGGEPLPPETATPAPGAVQTPAAHTPAVQTPMPVADSAELERLRQEVESLRAELATARADAGSSAAPMQVAAPDLPNSVASAPASMCAETPVPAETPDAAEAACFAEAPRFPDVPATVDMLAAPAPADPLHRELPSPDMVISSAKAVPVTPLRLPKRTRTLPGKGIN